MKYKPLRIGFLIFCIALAILMLTHTFKLIDGIWLFAIALLAFGIIRIFPEKKTK